LCLKYTNRKLRIPKYKFYISFKNIQHAQIASETLMTIWEQCLVAALKQRTVRKSKVAQLSIL